MTKLYLVVWEDEDSMNHGIHGGYLCPTLANHTAQTMDAANETYNYEVKLTELSTDVIEN